MPKLNRAISYIIRIIIGLIFVLSGITKLFSLQNFIEIVQSMKILPLILVPYFSLLLSIFEYILGMFLIFGIHVNETAKGITVLLIIFMFVITINLIKGNQVECGCFGTLMREKMGLSVIIRDVILLFCTLQIAFPNSYHPIVKQRLIKKFLNFRDYYGKK